MDTGTRLVIKTQGSGNPFRVAFFTLSYKWICTTAMSRNLVVLIFILQNKNKRLKINLSWIFLKRYEEERHHGCTHTSSCSTLHWSLRVNQLFVYLLYGLKQYVKCSCNHLYRQVDQKKQSHSSPRLPLHLYFLETKNMVPTIGIVTPALTDRVAMPDVLTSATSAVRKEAARSATEISDPTTNSRNSNMIESPYNPLHCSTFLACTHAGNPSVILSQ